MFDFLDMQFDNDAETSNNGPYIPPASECMRCGMCVGACPTFKLFRTEEETPRRRIRTISKVLVEDTAISTNEREHLDNCLQCRACESVCPSRMAYGMLFDQARAKVPISPNSLGKLAFWLIEHKNWLQRTLPLLAIYLKAGLQTPLRNSGLLKKLGLADAEALLGKPTLRPLHSFYPASGSRRGSVALFTGCVAATFDRDTLRASIQILNAIGFDVEVPTQQGCCGAIHRHNGRSADDLISNNLAVFNDLSVDAVIHVATGCGAMLSEYPGEDAAAAMFRGRLADINEFLLRHWPDDVPLKASNLTIALHEPCSQRNVLKTSSAPYALLARVPGLQVQPLADNQTCCGAGGSYMLTHPDNADALRKVKLQSIHASTADYVVSSNFGCTCFLNAALPKSRNILHPTQLLVAHL